MWCLCHDVHVYVDSARHLPFKHVSEKFPETVFATHTARNLLADPCVITYWLMPSSCLRRMIQNDYNKNVLILQRNYWEKIIDKPIGSLETRLQWMSQSMCNGNNIKPWYFSPAAAGLKLLQIPMFLYCRYSLWASLISPNIRTVEFCVEPQKLCNERTCVS